MTITPPRSPRPRPAGTSSAADQSEEVHTPPVRVGHWNNHLSADLPPMSPARAPPPTPEAPRRRPRQPIARNLPPERLAGVRRNLAEAFGSETVQQPPRAGLNPAQARLESKKQAMLAQWGAYRAHVTDGHGNVDEARRAQIKARLEDRFDRDLAPLILANSPLSTDPRVLEQTQSDVKTRQLITEQALQLIQGQLEGEPLRICAMVAQCFFDVEKDLALPEDHPRGDNVNAIDIANFANQLLRIAGFEARVQPEQGPRPQAD
jgi:hypothetical protein